MRGRNDINSIVIGSMIGDEMGERRGEEGREREYKPTSILMFSGSALGM